ncbi:ankyrin repeat domain-containing protein [Brachyspira murdochii]|uniref:Ankyrin repeat-containing protein n=1 Tax=Brachyspira murdochii (strain ATCC 51284 / DSM 12563 / 56-150) TaxID=526224 RepID=D5U5H8_BRAM5|nr:ankyrin repeat domain-containing protein [Brachyspira murdochii]ADG72455.1 ankyrin repeat-containing protein [Brachyspira murdochii DSM 12563]
MKKFILMVALSILISCSNKSNNTQNNITLNNNTNITVNNTTQNTNQITSKQTNAVIKKKFKNIYPIKPYTEEEIDEILYKTIDTELANYGISDNSKKERREEEKQKMQNIKDLLLEGINSKDEDGNGVLTLMQKLDYRNYAYNDLVKWLVEHGISLDDTRILDYDYTDNMIDYLLDSGVNFDYQTVYNKIDLKNNNYNLISKLIKKLESAGYYFSDIDYQLQSDLLFQSILADNLDLVILFLKLGADINSINRMSDGYVGTPLMYSAYYEKYDIMDYLKEKNADITIHCFQDTEELESIHTYDSHISFVLMENFPVLSPTNLINTVITGNNNEDLMIRILNKISQTFKFADTSYIYSPASQTEFTNNNEKYILIQSHILNEEYVENLILMEKYVYDFEVNDKYFNYVTIWKRDKNDENKAEFVTGFYPIQNDDYSQIYDIASSGNYITIESIDDGVYYYTFIIENNDFYLDKFSMEKYNRSDNNKKEEEHYYNYKIDASKFNHTSRIKAIDLERGFFNKLIEEYNK